MTINSLSFFVFFGVVLVLYYMPMFKKYQWAVLLIASYAFYLLAGTENLAYIIITTVSTHIAANVLDRKNTIQAEYLASHKGDMAKQEIKAYKEKMKRSKHKITALCICVNLGLLIVIKYGNFIAGNVNRIYTARDLTELSVFNIAVPLGISYYTLMSIGYVIDVSKGKCKSEKNLFKTALFVSYFPQITQGPIGRFSDMAPKLFGEHKFTYENFSYGFQKILWGFFKKMVIADRMKPLSDTIFLNYTEYSGFTLLLGCMYFSIQVYADFSGYMDIVSGVSKIFGIELAENFKRPFFSRSLAEYWRRWHITLSGWFRDYLFYPLSISKPAVKLGRVGKKFLPIRIAKLVPSVFALFIVWFSTGFWHDASWRYILWGIFNGVIIITSMCLEPWFQKSKEYLHIKDKNGCWKAFQTLRTFFIISFLKVFPAAESTKGTIEIVKKIIFEFQMDITYASCFPGLKGEDLFCILLGLVLFAYISYRQEKEPVHYIVNRYSFVPRWIMYLFILIFIVSFGVFDTGLTGGFEYAQY